MSTRVEHDEDWFTSIYGAHYSFIVRYGHRRLADLDASVELAQEVFVVAWRRREVVPDNALPWLYGVARRLLANQWRARRTAPDLLSFDDAGQQWEWGSADPDAGAVASDIGNALATLPEPDQEILRLVGWERLNLAEAAEVLGCARGTAAVRLHRARKRLAAAMSIPLVPPAPVSGAVHR